MQLLFEEFGKWLNASANATMVDRDATFTTIFDESQAIMNRPGTALKGLGRPSSLLCSVQSTLLLSTRRSAYLVLARGCGDSFW